MEPHLEDGEHSDLRHSDFCYGDFCCSDFCCSDFCCSDFCCSDFCCSDFCCSDFCCSDFSCSDFCCSDFCYTEEATWCSADAWSLTWKMASTVTGSVAEMGAPKTRLSRKDSLYMRNRKPPTYLQPGKGGHRFTRAWM